MSEFYKGVVKVLNKPEVRKAIGNVVSDQKVIGFVADLAVSLASQDSSVNRAILKSRERRLVYDTKGDTPQETIYNQVLFGTDLPRVPISGLGRFRLGDVLTFFEGLYGRQVVMPRFVDSRATMQEECHGERRKACTRTYSGRSRISDYPRL